MKTTMTYWIFNTLSLILLIFTVTISAQDVEFCSSLNTDMNHYFIDTTNVESPENYNEIKQCVQENGLTLVCHVEVSAGYSDLETCIARTGNTICKYEGEIISTPYVMNLNDVGPCQNLFSPSGDMASIELVTDCISGSFIYRYNDGSPNLPLMSNCANHLIEDMFVPFNACVRAIDGTFKVISMTSSECLGETCDVCFT